jgi:EAL and modified HD-GYP domain-containing signal transduction protein
MVSAQLLEGTSQPAHELRCTAPWEHRHRARQPILTRDGRVYGYELSYRDCPTSARAPGDLVYESLTDDAHLFIDMDDGLGRGPVPVLPNGRSVVEVAGSVRATPIVVRSLELLRQCGVSIALDDFQFDACSLPLLRHVDYVKVDIQACSGRLDEIVRRVEPYNLPLIGDKVETHAEVARCWELGFNLFQGNYFAAPDPQNVARIDVAALGLAPLITELQDPELSARELRTCWASLERRLKSCGNKSAELFVLAAIRGRLCQALGESTGEFPPNELLILGLLSVLDAVLDKPMQTLVAELPLAPRLSAALCADEFSALGRILNQARAYAAADWAALDPMTPDQERRLSRAYTEAVLDGAGATAA